LTGVMKQLGIAFMMLFWMILITGVAYPALVTVVAQCFFPWRANGSFIQHEGKIVGSQLIGQSFTADKYFWGRPSATTPFPYNAENSQASNLGPMNADLLTAVQARKILLANSDKQNWSSVPIDMVTTSASGLDPDISPMAALYQASRVAKARHLTAESVEKLLRNLIQKRTAMVLGEPRINVLELNLALDEMSQKTRKTRGS
jgi:K+-transporting ATPase ATPase C chain